MFYSLVRRLFLILAAPIFRFDVRGRDQIPAEGPAIVVAAHRSWLDPPCVGAAITRPVRFLIMRKIYVKPWANWFYRRMETLPVAPGGTASLASLRSALRALRRGELIGVFPEGRVATAQAPAELHAGAVMLAMRSGAPVLFLQIDGSARAWPHGKRWPRPARVTVRIGAPIAVPNGPEHDVRRAMMDELQSRLSRPLEAEPVAS